jgi:GLPGLI family protein
MKKLIILMAFLTINQLFSQDLKVLYSEKVIIPENILKNLSKTEKDNLIKNTKKKYYSLVYHKGESIYFPVSKLEFINDTIKMLVKNTVVDQEVISNVGVTKNIVYKNLQTHVLINELTFISKNYSIKDKLPNYSWKITNETKSINGIKVKKALGSFDNNTIIVWYSESIPVNDGPYYYYGLSGLILELNYGNKKEFKLEDIKYLKTSKNIDKPKNITPYISLKEFKNKIEQLH